MTCCAELYPAHAEETISPRLSVLQSQVRPWGVRKGGLTSEFDLRLFPGFLLLEGSVTQTWLRGRRGRAVSSYKAKEVKRTAKSWT